MKRKSLPLRYQGVSLAPPIFIDSSGRSGSTLLLDVLSSHPSIYRIHHSHIFTDNLSESDVYTVIANKKKYGLLVKFILAKIFYKLSEEKLLNFDFTQPILDDFKAIRTTKEFNDISNKYDAFNLCANYMTVKAGKKRWADKSHGNTFSSNEILEYYPEACFLQIYRDPRAACISGAIRDNDRPRYLFYNIARWLYYNFKINSDIRKLQDRFLNLSYESLVLRPEKSISDICDFICEDFTSEMLSINVFNTSYKTNVDVSSQKGGILKTQINSWKQVASKNNLLLVYLFTQKLSKRLGYDVSVNPCSVKDILVFMPYLIIEIFDSSFFVLKNKLKSVFYKKNISCYIDTKNIG